MPAGSHRKGRNGFGRPKCRLTRTLQTWLPDSAQFPEGNLIVKARFACATASRPHVPPELSPAGPVAALSREHPGRVRD
ncbi:MAG: hypothetical protein RJR37_00480 [Peptococcaceae bacterium MAG4]|nr:hypothetical protein [Peptococcaceae bacterium MAG4]